MNCCVLDIETTDFAAVGAGVLLCAVIKPLNKKPIVFRYDDMHVKPGNEGRLVRAVADELKKYDLWIGHNIVKFDWSWLRSRGLQFGIEFRPALAYDTFQAFKRMGFKTQAHPVTGRPKAGLAHTVDFFGIQQRKTLVGISRQHWQTVWGDKVAVRNSMDVLVEHCVADVEMNEELYWILVRLDLGCGVVRLK